MNCYKCGHGQTKVTNSRKSENKANYKVSSSSVVRQRRCLSCGEEWWTEEHRVSSGRTPIQSAVALLASDPVIAKVAIKALGSKLQKDSARDLVDHFLCLERMQ